MFLYAGNFQIGIHFHISCHHIALRVEPFQSGSQRADVFRGIFLSLFGKDCRHDSNSFYLPVWVIIKLFRGHAAKRETIVHENAPAATNSSYALRDKPNHPTKTSSLSAPRHGAALRTRPGDSLKSYETIR